MIIYFTEKYKFTKRLTMEGGPMKICEEAKLLGVILTNDFKWTKNTEYLLRRANFIMEMIGRLSSFNAPVEACLCALYKKYTRAE